MPGALSVFCRDLHGFSRSRAHPLPLPETLENCLRKTEAVFPTDLEQRTWKCLSLHTSHTLSSWPITYWHRNMNAQLFSPPVRTGAEVSFTSQRIWRFVQHQASPWLLLLPWPANPTLFLVSLVNTSSTNHMCAGLYASEKPGLRQHAVLKRRENYELGDVPTEIA